MAQKQTYRAQFLLRPDREVVQAYLYALGYAADAYGIELHEFVCMSNHDHLLFTDPNANGPDFIQTVHSFVARAVNALFGESDSLWSRDRYSAPVLPDIDTVIRKCLYVLLNPVKDGLVKFAWDWDGVTSWGMEYGVPRRIPRPEWFYRDDMPDEVEITLVRPEGLHPGLSDRGARAKLRRDAKLKQRELISERREMGKGFLGMGRVKRVRRDASPKKERKRGGVVPHFAGPMHLQQLAAAILRHFWSEYADALRDYRAGKTGVSFPAGTYLMRVRFGVPILGP